jgi:Glycosyltransferase family 87
VRSLDRRAFVLLGALLAVGTGIRLWIAFTNYGLRYDIDSAYIVARLLSTHPLHAYAALRYPYPAGYFPVILLCHWIAQATGAAFWAVWKVPAILCDAGIAALLAWALGRFGASPRERLVAAALVALGPVFILISGYHGQIDSAAILPALAGVIVWKLGGDRRAWQAGVLIGLGTAVKQPPFFVALALLPTARTRREMAILLGCAAAIPLLSVAPFLIADAHRTWTSLTYNKGLPGLGGLSVLLQPGLSRGLQHGYFVLPTPLTVWFYVKQNWIVGLSVVAVALYAYRKRLDPVPAAALIWLVVYVSDFDWAYQYFVWGLPFFLLAGWRREVAALQLGLALPAAQIYFHFGLADLGWVYVPLIMLVWAGVAVWFVAALRRTRIASIQ